jgi:hypothetical protein
VHLKERLSVTDLHGRCAPHHREGQDSSAHRKARHASSEKSLLEGLAATTWLEEGALRLWGSADSVLPRGGFARAL